MDFKIIGDKVREKRNALDLTQEEVAQVLDITPAHYSHVENGSRHGGIELYEKIKNFYHMTWDELFEQDVDPQEEEKIKYQILVLVDILSDRKQQLVPDIVKCLVNEEHENNTKKGTDARAKGFVLSAEGGMKWRNDSEKVEK